MSQTLGPVTSTERINALDILRGVSILGILLLNIVGFAFVFQAYGDPTVTGGEAKGWNLYVWAINNMLFEGTMRGMLSMLFGVGMVLMVSRMEQKGGGLEVADIYYRRTIWLLIFGLFHSYILLWAGEFLYQYGLFGLFIFPFRNAPTRKLMIAVVVLALIGVALQWYRDDKKLNHYEKFQLAQKYAPNDSIPAEIKAGKEAWEGIVADAKPNEKKLKEDVKAMHQGYFGVMMHLAPMNRFVQTMFTYDTNPWDVLPLMLLGIVLYRLKVITGGLSYSAYIIMIAIGYAVGLSINYYETMMVINDNFSVASTLKANLTYPFGRVAMIIGHIGVVMIFAKLNVLVFLKKALAATGRMALTNYMMHSVICAIIFTGVGFSLYGKLQRYELYYIVFGIWLFQLILSPIWLTYFRFGPMEWLWRSLTYQEWQPFRKVSDHKELHLQVPTADSL